MNTEEIPILPIIVGTLGLLYFGYEVEKQRHKLRQIFNVFDREESEIAAMLETMVESGQLNISPVIGMKRTLGYPWSEWLRGISPKRPARRPVKL